MPPLSEGSTSADLKTVRSFIGVQCPQWSGLPLRAMTTSGTEHTTYRLGGDLLVRIPRDADAEAGLLKEIEWLPRLRGCIPLEVPVIEHVGAPTDQHPRTWTVNRWIAGEDASFPVLAGDIPLHWADTLAELVRSFRAVGVTATSAEPTPKGVRGGHLEGRVEGFISATDIVSGPVDPSPVRHLIEAALAAGTPDPGPVLLHADLIPGNLVVREGEIVGLLDFGTLTTGYAAWDLTPAWWVLDAPGRARFHELLDVDEV